MLNSYLSSFCTLWCKMEVTTTRWCFGFWLESGFWQQGNWDLGSKTRYEIRMFFLSLHFFSDVFQECHLTRAIIVPKTGYKICWHYIRREDCKFYHLTLNPRTQLSRVKTHPEIETSFLFLLWEYSSAAGIFVRVLLLCRDSTLNVLFSFASF